MKFTRFTLSLLAVALLAAAPTSIFAGYGLLDGGCGCASQKSHGCATQKSCGCATQKGGHVMQKGGIVQNGYAHQKGGIVQNGGVHQKGGMIQKGGATQKGCGSSKGGDCGSCSVCLPRILPALLHGIDSVLNRVFCCDSCGSSKGCGCARQKGHIAQKGHVSQKGGSCGCDSSPAGPSNPFIDDLQPPPVLDLDGDARVAPRREIARPVSQGVALPTRTHIKTASASSREPRVLPAELVSPLDQIRERRTPTEAKPSVIRTSATTTSGLVVPSNPLR